MATEVQLCMANNVPDDEAVVATCNEGECSGVIVFEDLDPADLGPEELTTERATFACTECGKSDWVNTAPKYISFRTVVEV